MLNNINQNSLKASVMRRSKYRLTSGTSIAEFPISFWVYVFILLMPFIDLVTLGYRATIAYFCIRDAASQAAFQQTFSSACTTANSVLGSDTSKWTGISFSTPPTVLIIQVDQNAVETDCPNGANTNGGATSAGAWPNSGAQVLNTDDVYLLRVSSTATVSPLMDLTNSGTWGSVPGITAPVKLNFQYQVTFENVQGLTS